MGTRNETNDQDRIPATDGVAKMMIVIAIVVGVFVLGGTGYLAYLLFRSPTPEEEAEFRGATVAELRKMSNEQLSMLALRQMMEGRDPDVEDELKYRATGKREMDGK